MSTRNKSNNSSSATINTENEAFQSLEVKCVKKSGMVIGERLSEQSINEVRIETRTNDTDSISTENDDDECQLGQEIVVPGECETSFGNIVVKNSSDVHFGNNTYYEYEGPVIIKQIVRRSENADRNLPIENGGKENFGFQAETVIHNEESNENHDVLNVVEEENNNKTESSQGTQWLSYLYGKRKLLSVCVLFVMILIIFVVIFVNINKNTKVFMPQWWEESNLSGKLKIILRDDWLAEPPKEKISLTLPVPNVIILCTSTDSCTNRGKCTELTRYVQRIHMKTRGWSDIAYNFLVGGDGYVYEGRGWNNRGAHAHSWNPKSIGIGFIGNFVNVLPPEQQILAAKLLIEKGVKDGYIAQDYNLYAHLQLSKTESPGRALYENMKTWPHWTNKSYVPL